MIVNLPNPPYYTVIVTSIMSEDMENYEDMFIKMVELTQQQEGLLGIESVKNDIGITGSYWDSLDAIKN